MRRLPIVVATGCALVAAACGGDPGDDPRAGEDTVTIAEPPSYSDSVVTITGVDTLQGAAGTTGTTTGADSSAGWGSQPEPDDAVKDSLPKGKGKGKDKEE